MKSIYSACSIAKTFHAIALRYALDSGTPALSTVLTSQQS